MVKSETRKTGHFQKLAINKKSTILVLSSRIFVKMITSKNDYFHRVSWGKKKKLRIFYQLPIIECVPIFFPQTLFSNLKFRYRISYSHIISWLHSNTFFQKKTLHSKIQSTASNFEITLTGSNEHPWFFKTTVPKFIWFLKVQTILFV